MKIATNAKKHLSTKNSRLARNRALASSVAVSSAALWTGFASAPAHAATDAGALFTAGTTNGSRADGPYTIGTQFTVSGNTTITELGVQDQNNGNGTVGYTNTGTAVSGIVAGSTTVGIWSGNGTLLAKAVVTSSDLLGAGDYRYDTTLLAGNGTSISSLTLSAGQTYTVGAVVGGGVAYFNDAASATSGATSVTVGNAYFISNGTTLTEPTSAGGGGTGRWAPANGYISTALTAGVGNSTSTDYSIADSGGTLTLNSASTPGVASLQIAAAGGILDLGANTFTIANNYLEMTGAGNYTIQDGTLSGGNSSMSLVVIQAGTGTLNLNSVIGGGAAGFVKLGNGTAVMGASNTYTGATVLGGGILNVGIADSGGVSGPLGGNTSTILFKGGTLQYSSSNRFDYSGRIAAGTSTSAVSIDTNGQNVTFATALTSSQSGGLTKLGAGTLTLLAANLYTGGTIVSAGTLEIAGTGSLSSTSATTVNSAGILAIAGVARTFANAMTLSGGTVQAVQDNLGTGGTITVSGSNVIHTFTGNGTLTLPGNVTGASELIVGGGGGSSGQADGVSWGTGGGGGNVTNVTGASISVGSTPVTVGAGGVAGAHGSGNTTVTSGGNGTASSFNGTTDLGGVGGTTGAIAGAGIAGASGSGNAGGASSGAVGGGGGGASGVGGNATSSVGGIGGTGTVGTITGLTYGVGGIGQSPNGGSNQPGAAGTGNGGGGTASTSSPPGTAGGSGVVVVEYAYAPVAGAGTITLSGNISDTATSTLDAYGSGGSLTASGAISGNGGLNIASSNNAGGVVIFSGNNTYQGATTVQSGATLKLSGAFANNIGSSTSITVNSAGTLDVTGLTSTAGTLALASGQVLGGTGNVTGAIVVAAGSKISAGNSTVLGTGSGNVTGTLTTGSATWNGNGTYSWKTATLGTPGVGRGNGTVGGSSSTWDNLAMSSLNLTALGGGGGNISFKIQVSDTSTLATTYGTTDSWTIATSSGNVTAPTGYTIGTGANSNLLVPGTSGGAAAFVLDTSGFNVSGTGVNSSPSNFTLELVSAGSSGDNLVLDYNGTPEPGTTLLVLGGAVPTLSGRRRRRIVNSEL